MIAKKKECSGCQQEKYIFKNITVDGIRYKLCKECALKKDFKLKPSKAQLKKVSEKKKKLDTIYLKLRKIQLEKHPHCQINTITCTSIATEIHHSAYRNGDNYLNVDTWFAVCRNCHNFLHLNPEIARQNGWLK